MILTIIGIFQFLTQTILLLELINFYNTSLSIFPSIILEGISFIVMILLIIMDKTMLVSSKKLKKDGSKV